MLEGFDDGQVLVDSVGDGADGQAVGGDGGGEWGEELAAAVLPGAHGAGLGSG